MNTSFLARTIVAAAASVALVAGPSAASASGAALVLKNDNCELSLGDLPGLTEFVPLERSTVVILEQAGDVVVSCRGALPAEFTPTGRFEETFPVSVTTAQW